MILKRVVECDVKPAVWLIESDERLRSLAFLGDFATVRVGLAMRLIEDLETDAGEIRVFSVEEIASAARETRIRQKLRVVPIVEAREKRAFFRCLIDSVYGLPVVT